MVQKSVGNAMSIFLATILSFCATWLVNCGDSKPTNGPCEQQFVSDYDAVRHPTKVLNAKDFADTHARCEAFVKKYGGKSCTALVKSPENPEGEEKVLSARDFKDYCDKIKENI